MADRSDRQNQGRYVQGGAVEQFPKRIGWWERKVMEFANSDVQFVITPQYNKRPDTLAYNMYGSARMQWLVLQFNSIVDINEEFITGATIRLPLRSRVFSELLTHQTPLVLPSDEN
jgi:hypothetical protein